MSSARLRPPGRPPPLLPPGVRPWRCHCSLTSRLGPAPRPPSFSLTPLLWLLAPETLLPPKPRPSRAPPASRPGLRPLALSPTCLCYSSSLPRLASDTAAHCKTRSSEPPPHLGSAAGAGLKPPLARVGRGARTGARARARARVCCGSADYELGLRVPHIMSGGLEEGVWKRKGGGHVFVCVREHKNLVHRVMFHVLFLSVCAVVQRCVCACAIACLFECACYGQVHAYL